jgi:hypothetical protein
MEGRDSWWKYLRRAAAESSVPARNWRWMLASLGIGAGLGLIAGLRRLGPEPAQLTQDVIATTARVALFALVIGWLMAIAIHFSRLPRSHK